MRILPLALLPMIFLSANASAQQANSGPDYAIKFERPFSEGQAFSVKVTDTNHATQNAIQPDGSSERTETTRTLRLEGEALIDKVDEKGLEQTTLLTIRRFSTQIAGAAAVDLIPANSHLRVEYQGETVVFTLDSGKLSIDATTSLQQIFKPHKLNRVTDDQRYGTPERKKTGDTWTVDVKTMTRDRMSSGSQSLDPNNISGTVLLKSVKAAPALGNVQCAEVEATVQMKNIPVANLTPKESAMRVVITDLLPTDTSKPGISTTVKTTMHVVVDQPASPGSAKLVRTTVDSDLLRTNEWRLLP